MHNISVYLHVKVYVQLIITLAYTSSVAWSESGICTLYSTTNFSISDAWQILILKHYNFKQKIK